jgi:hypothetical protein
MVLFENMTRPAKPLSVCLKQASEEGYSETFKVSGSLLLTDDGQYKYDAEEVNIDQHCRFDGHAPGDDSIVYLLETGDGRRGVLIDVFGPYADTRIAKFIRKVEACKAEQKLREGRSWKDFLKGY